jgi:hypothetical protein
MNPTQNPESTGQIETVKSTTRHILEMLNELPPESLVVINADFAAYVIISQPNFRED